MDINSKNTIDNEKSEDEIRESAKKQALEKLKQKAVIVNIDEIAEAEARKAADAYMTEDKGKSNIFKKFWKHTFVEGYFRQKEINKVREEIKNTGNIYTGRIKDDNKAAHENTMQAITDRFASDYEGTLSDDEEKKILDNKDPESLKIKTDIKNLISEYAKGNLDEEAFRNEKTRILDSLNKKDKFSSSVRYADNLFEIAKNARVAVEHGAKMEELELDTNIIIGKAKSSLKTEAHFNNVDKIIDKVKKTKVGQIISPTALATTIGLAYSLSIGVGTKVLRSKAAAYGTFGAAVAVSSALAGMNESQRLAAERAQHAVEMAEGSQFEEGSKRREQMEKYNYRMESSKDLSSNLRDLLYKKDENGKDIIKDIKPEDLQGIFASIANIEARRSLNKERKIDLISYSEIGSVEKESTDLIILVGKAKLELRKKIENDFKDGIPNGESFDSYLAKQTEILQNSLLRGSGERKGIDTLDREFKKYKTKEVAKKIAKTALFGLVIGATVQEGVAFFKDDVQGMFEGMLGHTDGNVITQTPLEHLRGWMTGHPSHMGMGGAIESHINGNNFRLPVGTSIIQNSDGTYDILKGDQVISNHIPLHFDSNGNMDADSLSRLGEDGIVASTTHAVIDGTQEVSTNAHDYINNHLANTHHIARDGWYDNDTPKPIFDQNELKLHWGGGNGASGIDSNGNYVFNTSQMASDGSFHDQFSVDAQDEIKKGGLKMILSLTQGTQHQVFEVPIDIHGNAVIDPNSEIGKLFFATENGHAVFKGRFAEVVQSFGEKNGVEHVKSLATLVGQGNDLINDTIHTHIDNSITNLDLPLDVEPPYFIPIISRNPLEKLKEKEEDTQMFYYFGGSGFETNENQKAQYEKDRSKTLRENSDATLDQFKEIESYLKKQDKKYLKYLEDISKEMGPINKECRLSVCVPVAGHQEGESIYQTLKNYSSQTVENDKFEIVLFVNRPEKDEKGNEIKPDATMSEIERFKKDYPNINIRISDKILPIENAKIGYIRKVMNDAVLMRQYSRGNDSPELFMVSNDADNKGLAPQYIENFISKFDGQKEVDSMVGQLDWDPGSYVRNPLIHIGTRLFQYEGAQSRAKGWHFNSSGANFAFRSSIYAAVGGYSDQLKGGEDTDFGAKITSARQGAKNKKPIIYAGSRTSRLYTSSRRAEMVMKNFGLSPIEQWDKGFSAFDDEVRKVNWEAKGDKVDFSNKEEVSKLVSALEVVINRTIERTKEWNGSTNDPALARSLGWLGIKYEITGDHSIKITDSSKLIEGLEQYQKEGLALLKKKTTYIKNKKEKERLNNEKIEIEKEMEVFVNKFSDSNKKIEKLNNLISQSLSDDTLKKLGLDTSIEKISKKIKDLKKISNSDEFNANVKNILEPVITALQNNPKESAIFQRKAFTASHEFIPVNDLSLIHISEPTRPY